MKKNTKIIVWSIVGLVVATGAFFGIRSLVKKAKARKAIRDTPQPELDVNAPTGDQAKKAWLDKEAVDFPSITDKKRLELFTKIPNYIEGSLAIRNVDSTLTSSDDKIAQYFPKGDHFVWTSETNLIGWRDNKKEDLKIYLENGNIVSCSPNLGKGLVWKYLGKWK